MAGARPLPLPSPLSKSEPPAPRALRTGPALAGPPQRERAPLVWTNVGVLAWNEPKVRGISAWAWPLIFLITHRKLLLQRTLSQSIYTEDWGSYGVSLLSPFLPGVWAGGVSTNKLQAMPPKDSLHCLYVPRWHLIRNADAVLTCALTSYSRIQNSARSPCTADKPVTFPILCYICISTRKTCHYISMTARNGKYVSRYIFFFILWTLKTVVVSNWQELRHYLLSLGPISPSGFGLASRDCPWRQGWRRLRGGGAAVHGSPFFFPSLNWISHHSNLGLEPGMDWELASAFQPPGFRAAMLAEFESREKILGRNQFHLFCRATCLLPAINWLRPIAQTEPVFVMEECMNSLWTVLDIRFFLSY